MKTWVLVLLLAVGLGGGGGGLLVWHYNHYINAPVDPDGIVRRVVIPKGADFPMTSEILTQEGYISLPLYFRVYALRSGLAQEIKPGVYFLDPHLSPALILDELVTGPRVPYHRVTIPEGSNMWEVAAIVEKSGMGSANEWLALMKDEELLKEAGGMMPESAEVLTFAEGWLFPETYFVEPGQKARELFKVMVRQAKKELRLAKKRNLEGYARLIESFKLSDSQLLTLASMVEAETALPYEKKLVASVFYNRLQTGMPLQSDPTLTYSLERKGAAPTKADRQNKKNRYSTYAFDGLPPGPIGNPGREAMVAVVAPARSKFLYFVAKRDGSGGHHFSTSYEEHVQAVKKYLKDR